MTRFLFSLVVAATLFITPAMAQDRPVVVELYTSQGCSSCPPADAYLHKLVERDDVIALALHVDYWDYIGWKDSFGSPAWSQRQRSYASGAGRSMVYTPQMIINGSDHVVGNRPKDVEDLIERHSRTPLPVAVVAKRSGNRVTVTASADETVKGPFVVQLVRYSPKQTVEIKRGENAGRTLSYANVVSEIAPLRTWNGRAPLSVEAAMPGDLPGVILIQKKDHGAVVAAAKVK
ncbi:DUF1223 domain-containing protein [Roseovarius sp. 2305UL8-3]|uniref:DUF1223 domain-containing protein n=1 Tax=Roseovarius conchicola TaxID=3121636 RepID=UPI0035291515